MKIGKKVKYVIEIFANFAPVLFIYILLKTYFISYATALIILIDRGKDVTLALKSFQYELFILAFFITMFLINIIIKKYGRKRK